MSDMMTPKKVFISVTLDFLAQLPGVNLKTRNGLRAALYAVGFDLENIDVMKGKNVRCKNKTTHYRKADIFAGTMRKDFLYPEIYRGVDILDVEEAPEDALLVSDLPYDIPVEDRVNVRKYTKRQDKEQQMSIGEDEPFDIDDFKRLEKLFGLEA